MSASASRGAEEVCVVSEADVVFVVIGILETQRVPPFKARFRLEWYTTHRPKIIKNAMPTATPIVIAKPSEKGNEKRQTSEFLVNCKGRQLFRFVSLGGNKSRKILLSEVKF